MYLKGRHLHYQTTLGHLSMRSHIENRNKGKRERHLHDASSHLAMPLYKLQALTDSFMTLICQDRRFLMVRDTSIVITPTRTWQQPRGATNLSLNLLISSRKSLSFARLSQTASESQRNQSSVSILLSRQQTSSIMGTSKTRLR